MPVILQLLGAADGITKTPHDGRWFVSGDPHTPFGELAMTSTNNKAEATRFDTLHDAIKLWMTVSLVQPTRPDGKPNRPLNSMNFIAEGVA